MFRIIFADHSFKLAISAAVDLQMEVQIHLARACELVAHVEVY